MLSSVCTGCGFQNEFSTSWLFWRTEFYMATTTLPWFADQRRRFARSTTTPLCQHQPPHGTASETVNSRQLSFCGRGFRHLEQTANWRRHCKFTVDFLATVKTFFIPAIISWCSILTSPNQWSLQWLCDLVHFKNWLIDWLIHSVCSTASYVVCIGSAVCWVRYLLYCIV